LKFLIDESVSPLVAERLAAAGHDATHVHAIGLTGASDIRILERSAAEDRVLVTLDTDFGASWRIRGRPFRA
jgi:predicted nuclease of predicted toxin-antitoxin system